MKKVLVAVIAIMLASTATFAQDTTRMDLSDTPVFNTTDVDVQKTKVEVTPYVAAGLSMTNTNEFKSASYPSAEIGVMFDNMTVAGVFGRNNLSEANPEHIDNYWCEAKVAYGFPLGWVDGYGVFGVGTYIGANGSLFIEYGGGVMKSFGSVGAFLQVSSWDGITYMTPGLSYSF